MFLVFGILIFVVSSTSASLYEEIANEISSRNSYNCSLPNHISVEKCDGKVSNRTVVSMTYCVGYNQLGEENQLVCLDGFWYLPGKYTDSENPHRSKRFFWFFVAIVVSAVAAISCKVFCNRRKAKRVQRNNPPQIELCPKNIYVNADKGKTTAKVTWRKPTCKDDRGKCKLVKNGQGSGSIFRKGTTYITYIGTDNAGNRANCKFKVRVNVRTCHSLGIPEYSYRKCTPSNYMYDQKFIYGTRCTFSCRTGYELVGQSTLICQENGKYNAPQPTCKVISCPPPVSVLQGYIICTSGFVYDSVCFLRCNPGSQPLTDSPSSIVCKGDKTWTHDFNDCIDIKPPAIECPEDLHLYAERSQSYANVTWEEPKTNDNSRSMVTLEYSAEIKNGGIASVGIHKVRYIAKDKAGNTSPCSFRVTIEELTCAPPPFKDINLRYDCPKGYGYGQVCSLSCLYGFPLEGPSIITCERDNTTTPPTGYWRWNATDEPSCKDNLCSPLDPPQNGALSCSSAGLNKYCKMTCNDKFDIPKSVNPLEMIFCDNNGKWAPIQEVPDCTEKRTPGSMNLPGEIHYYVSNCSDVVQNEIKNNFVTFAKEKNKKGWEGVCPKSPCTVKDVEVSCGPSNLRRKRFAGSQNEDSAFEIVLSYEISMPWVDTENDDGMSQNIRIIEKLGKVIINASNSCKLDVRDLKPSAVTYSSSKIECPKGQTPRESTGSCAGCPTGTFYNDTIDDCQPCPVGSYQDQAFQFTCNKCPNGTSTDGAGARNNTSCKDTCRPGYYSTNGIEPCSPCAYGFYQESPGSTECRPCPSETTTARVGSTDKTACEGFDIQFKSNNTMLFRSVTSNVAMFVSEFWLKLSSVENEAESFIYSDGFISIIIGKTVKVEVNKNRSDTDIAVSNSGWINIVVETNLDLKEARLFLDREEIGSGYLISADPKNMTLKGSSGILLSSFMLANASFQSVNNSHRTTNCKSSLLSTLLNMDIFKSVDSKPFTFQMPSTCDPIDECLTDPCGNHKCTNYLGGYRCHCSDGFTGKNCEIPPDHCKSNDCNNGAVCINGKISYTCACTEGYRGSLCNTAIVNGNWSVWSSWSKCTQTCEGGIRYRERYCDNPPPDPDGKQCAGENNQTETCNQQDCPTCPPTTTIRRFGNVLNCTDTDDIISCSVTCKKGLVFAIGYQPLDQYECGSITGYEWNAIPPSCSKARKPDKLDVQTVGGYSNFPCDAMEEVKDQLRENVKDIQCIKNNTCQSEITVSGCSSTQTGKHNNSNVRASISLTSKLTGGDNLNLEEFFESGIVTPELRAYVQAFADIESSAQQMNESTPFKFSSQGIEYDAESVEIEAIITCEPGSIQSDGICVDCPAGTKQIDEKCESCKIGTYQNETGQTKCNLCPDGSTTDFIGSDRITDCKAIMTTLTTVTNARELIPNAKGDGDAVVITLSVVGSIILVILIIFIAWKICNHRRGKHLAKKSTMYNNLHLAMEKTDSHSIQDE